jgi:hypothetical protein
MSSPRPKEEIERDVQDYFESHSLLTMATASKDGEPDATALEYSQKGFDIYVSVRPSSRKVTNIQENPRIFYEIHDPTPIERDSIKNLRAIQATATGVLLHYNDPGFNDAFDLMVKKFPIFASMNREKRVIIHMKPKKIWLLNYKRKMFDREELDFES